MDQPKHPLSEVLKDGFAWMVIFLIVFVFICKWATGA